MGTNKWGWVLMILVVLMTPVMSWGWKGGDVQQDEKVLVVFVGDSDGQILADSLTEMAISKMASIGLQSIGSDEAGALASQLKGGALNCVESARCINGWCEASRTLRALVGSVMMNPENKKNPFTVKITTYSVGAEGMDEQTMFVASSIEEAGARFLQELSSMLEKEITLEQLASGEVNAISVVSSSVPSDADPVSPTTESPIVVAVSLFGVVNGAPLGAGVGLDNLFQVWRFQVGFGLDGWVTAGSESTVKKERLGGFHLFGKAEMVISLWDKPFFLWIGLGPAYLHSLDNNWGTTMLGGFGYNLGKFWIFRNAKLEIQPRLEMAGGGENTERMQILGWASFGICVEL